MTSFRCIIQSGRVSPNDVALQGKRFRTRVRLPTRFRLKTNHRARAESRKIPGTDIYVPLQDRPPIDSQFLTPVSVNGSTKPRPLNGDKGVVRPLLYQVVAGHQLHSWFPVIEKDWASAVLQEVTNVVVESHTVVKHHAKIVTGFHKKVELMQRRNVPILRLPGNRQRSEHSDSCQRLSDHSASFH